MTNISIVCVEGIHDFNIHWRNKEKLHRLDGPAAILPNGNQHWFKDGERHRDDGPAVILSDGTQVWYKEGKLIKREAK